ncbi:hypothetical protein [Haloechinothrix halophila]|uniref:hypothetical protein n=1 Tax=Haloechinothrix halophila TaxID=1069073 RepID=UPI000411DB63|nr:hypothetical protein [Haloechinothrix halophila]
MVSTITRHQQDTESPVDADVSTRISTPMVDALEQAWADIRERHPELPPAVIVLGAGSIGSRSGALTLGHFAAMRWHTDTDGSDQLAEVFIGGEGLQRGPAGVLATLLHEAAHALAHTRGIKDTSRQGRYHNTKFKAVAEEVGITVTKDPRIGWSPTDLPDTTRNDYAHTVEVLSEALRLYRRRENTDSGTTKTSNPPPCVCQCGRRIRVATSVRDAGPITCGICGTNFEPEQQ